MTRNLALRAVRRRPSLFRSLLSGAGAVAVITATLYLAADETQTPAPMQRADSASHLLVLQTGRVISGRISQSAGGYIVEKNNGSMVIPFQLVQFEATDLADAHQTLQRMVPKQTPQTRMNLARWCLANRMHSEALQEVRAALQLEPGNVEASQMLERVETLINRQASSLEEPTPQPERTPDGFRAQSPESLSGLSADTVRLFNEKVQPILLNKCGNVSCHGRPGETGFHLTHAHSGQGSRRRILDGNLAEALKQVNVDRPGESPLLAIPRGNHGRNGRPIFAGPRDVEMQKTLEEWISQVEFDRTGKRKHHSAAAQQPFPKASSGGKLIAGRSKSDSRVAGTQNTASVNGELPQSPFPSSATGNAAQSTPTAIPGLGNNPAVGGTTTDVDAYKSRLHDTFDPGDFNRKANAGRTPQR